jgi:hypothetical protein
VIGVKKLLDDFNNGKPMEEMDEVEFVDIIKASQCAEESEVEVEEGLVGLDAPLSEKKAPAKSGKVYKKGKKKHLKMMKTLSEGNSGDSDNSSDDDPDIQMKGNGKKTKRRRKKRKKRTRRKRKYRKKTRKRRRKKKRTRKH